MVSLGLLCPLGQNRTGRERAGVWHLFLVLEPPQTCSPLVVAPSLPTREGSVKAVCPAAVRKNFVFTHKNFSQLTNNLGWIKPAWGNTGLLWLKGAEVMERHFCPLLKSCAIGIKGNPPAVLPLLTCAASAILQI